MGERSVPHADGGTDTVAHHYPLDGCYDRAHVMARRMEALGIHVRKAWVMSMKPRLGQNTRLGGPNGMHLGGGNGSASPVGLRVASDTPAMRPVEWQYHVAPVIDVVQPNGHTVEMVIDPSLSPTPLTVDAWVGMMSTGRTRRMSEAQLDAMNSSVRSDPEMPAGDLPITPGVAHVATSDVNRTSPVEPTGTRQQADQTHEANRPLMQDYGRLGNARELAIAIRRQLAARPSSPDAVLEAIRQASPHARSLLYRDHPELRNEIGAALPGSLGAVDNALGPVSFSPNSAPTAGF